MFKTTLVALLVLVTGSAAYGQLYERNPKKVGKPVVTEIPVEVEPAVQVKPANPATGKPVVQPKVDPNQVQPQPVTGKVFANADAVGVVVPIEMWMGGRKFVEPDGKTWQLVYGSSYAIQPTRLPGWHIRTEQNRDYLFTTDGRLFCFSGIMDLEAIRKKIAS